MSSKNFKPLFRPECCHRHHSGYFCSRVHFKGDPKNYGKQKRSNHEWCKILRRCRWLL